MIICYFLLPLVAADGNESRSNEPNTIANQISASDNNQKDMDFFNYYQDASLMPGSVNSPQIFSMAFPVSNLSRNKAADLLAINISSDPTNNTFSSEILAIRGSDGEELWQKKYTGALAFAAPAGDLNDDGLTDIMLDVLFAGTDFIPYSSVAALDGRSGKEIWSRSQILAVTLAYPIKDINEDNASEFLVHVFGIDSLKGTLATSISSIDGANGTEIDSRIFPGAITVEYPAGNLTMDQVPDSIRASYEINLSTEEGSAQNISTTLEALDGKGHAFLWNQTFASFSLAMPIQDLIFYVRD
ncbi:Uncharacterised protein [uncultured archaeon]|nr:Uncharacterised protein [uncultured archaeon]